MVAAEELLEVIEEGFDLPADRKDPQDRIGVRVQQTGHKIAGLLYTGVRRVTHNQNLAGAQLFDYRADPMDEHAIAARSGRPYALRKLFGRQRNGILIKQAV